MNNHLNYSSEETLKPKEDLVFTDLLPEEAASVNGGGRIWRKIKRFFQRIWYGNPGPYEPGNQNEPDPSIPIHPPIHF
ncbi:MAG: hypothetical protein LDL41_03745 [Coleofasciculus sp. S288]|nr:hypothetical protein [Coleofasciculus sp. S288]